MEQEQKTGETQVTCTETRSSEVVQLSIFIENRAGRMHQITQLLKGAGVNVRGYMISDTLDYGIVRFVVDKPEAGEKVLREAGVTVKTNPILVAKLGDKPGDLDHLFQQLAAAGVNMVYSYSLISTYVAIMVADIKVSRQLLSSSDVTLISQEELSRFTCV